jgi:voltage-gated potassium channel
MKESGVLNFVVPSLPAVRRDLVSNRKWLLGIGGTFVLWAVVFASAYVLAENNTAHIYPTGEANSNPITWWDSLYFTIINLTTVGFGDIVPHTAWGRIVAVANSLAGVVFIGLFIAVFAAAFQGSAAEASTKPSRSDSGIESDEDRPSPDPDRLGGVSMVLSGLARIVGGAGERLIDGGHVRVQVRGEGEGSFDVFIHLDVYVPKPQPD